MSPSRRGDPGRARSADERERDRLERERRRARDRGSAFPAGDEAPLFDAEQVWLETPPYEEPDPPAVAPPHFEPPPPASAEPAPAYEDYAAPLPPASLDHQPAPPPAEEPAGAPPWPESVGGEPPWPEDLGGDPGFADHGAPPLTPEVPAPRGRPARVGRRGAVAADAPAGGLPAALARASAALAGASAALAGRSASARAALQGKLARTGRSPTGGGDAAAPAADSLPTPRRSRTPSRARPRSRPAGRTAPRPRVRSRTTPVSKTKRNLTPAGAPTSRRGRIAAVGALLAVVFALWFLFSLFQPFKGGGHGTVAVDIPRGASSSTIATLLADRGVISSGFFFKLRATLTGKRSQLESGHFVLRRDMSYGATLDALTGHQGTPTQITVTIPEGLSRTEIAVLAKRDGITGNYARASIHSHVLKPQSYGARAAHSLEGFLFPSTYDLLPGDPASKLVNAQLTAFKTNLAKVDLSRARAKNLSPYDVLIIASMIEREAQRASERPLIAAVIYNRLHTGTPLGIDATIRYAINDYSRPLTESDLTRKSPYNTRLVKGLPPTPIGNPGLASLQAAAHPAAVAYMYYVVKPNACGQHAFSTTFAQFQQDVARYNNARAAKGGNSPTSCAH